MTFVFEDLILQNIEFTLIYLERLSFNTGSKNDIILQALTPVVHFIRGCLTLLVFWIFLIYLTGMIYQLKFCSITICK